MNVNKENVIKSLKACSDRFGKCESCIYSEMGLTRCINHLCENALKIIAEFQAENNDLKSKLNEVTDLVAELSDCLNKED